MLVEEAYKKYEEAMVRAMVSFSRDEEAARDGVSQAFSQALVHKLMLEAMPEPAMKAWLYAAARNAVVDIKRRETRLSQLSGKNDFADVADPRQADLTGKALAEALLKALPEPLRIPVELKYYQGLNAAEIGEAMRLPPATVRTRLRTALRRMRNDFEDGGTENG